VRHRIDLGRHDWRPHPASNPYANSEIGLVIAVVLRAPLRIQNPDGVIFQVPTYAKNDRCVASEYLIPTSQSRLALPTFLRAKNDPGWHGLLEGFLCEFWFPTPFRSLCPEFSPEGTHGEQSQANETEGSRFRSGTEWLERRYGSRATVNHAGVPYREGRRVGRDN